MLNKADKHYKEAKLFDIEPIEFVEEFARTRFEKIDPTTLVNITYALKYILRAGYKTDTEQDLYKAANLLHRAATGRWL